MAWEKTPELQQFINPVEPPDDTKDHLLDIKVDPDGQLNPDIRAQFWDRAI